MVQIPDTGVDIGVSLINEWDAPVVQQYVRRPHLVRSKTKVLYPRVLRLVPLEVVVIPML